MTPPLLVSHLKPLPEGEGPSSHWNDAIGLANGLPVLTYRILMTIASRHSSLAPCTRTHTARPLLAHSTGLLKTVQVSNPNPSGFCNSSILHIEMNLWTITVVWSCLLPREGRDHMSLQIDLNIRARRRHNSQGFLPPFSIPIRPRKLGWDSVPRGLLQG